jgi:hypothetical protein
VDQALSKIALGRKHPSNLFSKLLGQGFASKVDEYATFVASPMGTRSQKMHSDELRLKPTVQSHECATSQGDPRWEENRLSNHDEED